MTHRTYAKVVKHQVSIGAFPGSRAGEWGNPPTPMGSSEKCPEGTIRDPKTGKCVGLVQGPLTDDIKAKNGPYGPAGEPKPKRPHPAPGSKLPPNMPPGPAKPGSKHPAPKRPHPAPGSKLPPNMPPGPAKPGSKHPAPKRPHPAPGSKLPPNMPPGPAKPGSKHPAPKPKRPKRGLRSVKRGGRRRYSGKTYPYISPDGTCGPDEKPQPVIGFGSVLCHSPKMTVKPSRPPKITASKKKPARKRRRTRI